VRKFQDLRAMSMTFNMRAQAAIPYREHRNLSSLAGLFSPREKTRMTITRGRGSEHGERVMELRVQLKVCEGRGCLWYRAQTQQGVYCKECEVKLKDFPTPDSRKRRGRPGRKPLIRIWAAIEATGGTQ
jgi:hypothetical protein